MSDNYRKVLIAQVRAESLITAAKQSEISIMEVDHSIPSFTESSPIRKRDRTNNWSVLGLQLRRHLILGRSS